MHAHKYAQIREHVWARIRTQEHENPQEVQQFNNFGELMEWLKQPDQTK
jgi:hypothetical protein